MKLEEAKEKAARAEIDAFFALPHEKQVDVVKAWLKPLMPVTPKK